MDEAARSLEAAVWAVVEGVASVEQVALLEADPSGQLRTLERLIDDTEDRLDAVRDLTGPERDQVIADFEDELASLEAAYDLFTRGPEAVAAAALADPAGEVRLQASWSAGEVVVWAGGPGSPPASNDELADRLEAIGGPAVGWSLHAGVAVPGGVRAEAVSIPVDDALGWLVAVGAGLGGDGVGSSVTWLGRAAIMGVRLVAKGAIVPTLKAAKRPDGKTVDLAVRWKPALIDDAELDELAQTMPGPVTA